MEKPGAYFITICTRNREEEKDISSNMPNQNITLFIIQIVVKYYYKNLKDGL